MLNPQVPPPLPPVSTRLSPVVFDGASGGERGRVGNEQGHEQEQDRGHEQEQEQGHEQEQDRGHGHGHLGERQNHHREHGLAPGHGHAHEHEYHTRSWQQQQQQQQQQHHDHRLRPERHSGRRVHTDEEGDEEEEEEEDTTSSDVVAFPPVYRDRNHDQRERIPIPIDPALIVDTSANRNHGPHGLHDRVYAQGNIGDGGSDGRQHASAYWSSTSGSRSSSAATAGAAVGEHAYNHAIYTHASSAYPPYSCSASSDGGDTDAIAFPPVSTYRSTNQSTNTSTTTRMNTYPDPSTHMSASESSAMYYPGFDRYGHRVGLDHVRPATSATASGQPVVAGYYRQHVLEYTGAPHSEQGQAQAGGAPPKVWNAVGWELRNGVRVRVDPVVRRGEASLGAAAARPPEHVVLRPIAAAAESTSSSATPSSSSGAVSTTSSTASSANANANAHAHAHPFTSPPLPPQKNPRPQFRLEPATPHALLGVPRDAPLTLWGLPDPKPASASVRSSSTPASASSSSSTSNAGAGASTSSGVGGGGEGSNAPEEDQDQDQELELDLERPPYAYHVLMKLAILGTRERKATLQDIIGAIRARFPYYARLCEKERKAFENSIRHLLSLLAAFVRLPKPATQPGKGAYWTVDFTKGEGNKRERKRNKKRKAVVDGGDGDGDGGAGEDEEAPDDAREHEQEQEHEQGQEKGEEENVNANPDPNIDPSLDLDAATNVGANADAGQPGAPATDATRRRRSQAANVGATSGPGRATKRAKARHVRVSASKPSEAEAFPSASAAPVTAPASAPPTSAPASAPAAGVVPRQEQAQDEYVALDPDFARAYRERLEQRFGPALAAAAAGGSANTADSADSVDDANTADSADSADSANADSAFARAAHAFRERLEQGLELEMDRGRRLCQGLCQDAAAAANSLSANAQTADTDPGYRTDTDIFHFPPSLPPPPASPSVSASTSVSGNSGYPTPATQYLDFDLNAPGNITSAYGFYKVQRPHHHRPAGNVQHGRGASNGSNISNISTSSLGLAPSGSHSFGSGSSAPGSASPYLYTSPFIEGGELGGGGGGWARAGASASPYAAPVPLAQVAAPAPNANHQFNFNFGPSLGYGGGFGSAAPASGYNNSSYGPALSPGYRAASVGSTRSTVSTVSSGAGGALGLGLGLGLGNGGTQGGGGGVGVGFESGYGAPDQFANANLGWSTSTSVPQPRAASHNHHHNVATATGLEAHAYAHAHAHTHAHAEAEAEAGPEVPLSATARARERLRPMPSLEQLCDPLAYADAGYAYRTGAD